MSATSGCSNVKQTGETSSHFREDIPLSFSPAAHQCCELFSVAYNGGTLDTVLIKPQKKKLMGVISGSFGGSSHPLFTKCWYEEYNLC